MIVEVTKKDIELGLPKSRHACPVALAVRRATGKPRADYAEVTVMRDVIFHGFTKSTRCSRRVKQFIKRFDDGKEVSPFRFRLRS